MTDETAQEKLKKRLEIDASISLIFNQISNALLLLNELAPKKLIRNYLAYAVIGIIDLGYKVGVDVQEGINMIFNQHSSDNIKEESKEW